MSDSQTLPAQFRQVWPLFLGNILEWYEFGIYGFLAVNLQVVFFHKSNVFTWVGYTVTFVLRPVGGLLNGWLADRFGRRPAVLHSLVGMLVATVGQGLLPTSACCGETCGTVGLVLLLLLRALQGLSAGGELGPIVSYFAETAPPGWKRTSTGLLTSTAGVGFLMANLVVALTVNLLGTEEMNRWGWRLPFLLALPPGLISLWGRSNMAETAEFLRTKAERSEDHGHHRRGARLLLLFRDHGLAVVLGFWGVGAVAVAYYSGLWCPSYLKSRGLSQVDSLVAGCVFAGIVALNFFLVPFLNDLCCRIDPMGVMLFGSLGLAVTGFLVFAAISSASQNLLLISTLVLGLAYGTMVGLTGSHMYIFVADLFPTSLRALGFGLSFNLAFAILGGTASLVDASLADAHFTFGVGLYWSILGLGSVLALSIGRCLRSHGRLPSQLLVNKDSESPGRKLDFSEDDGSLTSIGSSKHEGPFSLETSVNDSETSEV